MFKRSVELLTLRAAMYYIVITNIQVIDLNSYDCNCTIHKKIVLQWLLLRMSNMLNIDRVINIQY